MHSLRLIQAAVFLCFCGCFLSCSTPFKKGKKSFDLAEYSKSIKYFEEAQKKGGNKAEINTYIAEAYRKSNRLQEAEPFYKAALDAGSSDDDVRFYYALALKANGQYEEAKKRLELYAQSGGSTDHIRRAKDELESFEKIKKILETKTYYEVEACSGLNTEEAEFAPVLYNGQLLFTSTRKSGTYLGTGGAFSGIYAFDFTDKEDCRGDARLFEPNLTMSDVNEGTPAFAHDGSFVIFARSGTGEKGDTDEVQLYISRKTEDGWSEAEIIPYPVNVSENLYEISGLDEMKGSRGEYWSSTPTITPDGRRMYFASNRPGGQGGLDIWRAEVGTGGRLYNVRNAGAAVNTPGNEMFPYVTNDGRLFFASDGHPGIGSLDLFVAERRDGKTTIKNLGVPMNSKGDDFALVFDTDSTGYFSSNREGGKGNDDIYKFRDVTPDRKTINYFLVVNVLGKDPSQPQLGEYPLAKAEVEIFEGSIAEHNKQDEDLFTNDQGKTKAVPLSTSIDYVLVGDAGDEYYKEELPYTLAGQLVTQAAVKDDPRVVIDTTYEVDLVLEKIIIQDEEYDPSDTLITKRLDIFFDFDKAEIKAEAAAVLDSFVVFLKDNPRLEVELSSHTDAVGTDAKNLNLSQRRAESTVNYLVEKGIDSDRLKARGYGEKYLRVDTQEAEVRNRRTEMRVIGIRPKKE